MNDITKEIERIEAAVAAPESLGTECEVYSRISGYYRSVKNWNLGKRQ